MGTRRPGWRPHGRVGVPVLQRATEMRASHFLLLFIYHVLFYFILFSSCMYVCVCFVYFMYVRTG